MATLSKSTAGRTPNTSNSKTEMKTEVIKEEDKAGEVEESSATAASSSKMKKTKAEDKGTRVKKPCLSLSDKKPSRARKTVRKAQGASSTSNCDFYHILLRVTVSRGLDRAVTGRQLRDRFWRDARTR